MIPPIFDNLTIVKRFIKFPISINDGNFSITVEPLINYSVSPQLIKLLNREKADGIVL